MPKVNFNPLSAKFDYTANKASDITDFDTEVENNPAVVLNTAKVTNATHTGDVTGSGALTIANDAVTNAKAANMAVNTIKGRITSGTGDPEDLSTSQIRTLVSTAVDGGTTRTSPSDTDLFTFLRSSIFEKITWANLKAAITALYVTLTTTQTISGAKTFTGSNTFTGVTGMYGAAGATPALRIVGDASHDQYYEAVDEVYNSSFTRNSFRNALGGGYWSHSHYVILTADTYGLFIRNHSTQTAQPILIQNNAGSSNIFLVSPTGRVTCQGAYLGYAPTVADLAAVTEGLLVPRNADMGNQIWQDYQDELAFVDKFADSITLSDAPLATVSNYGNTVNEVMFRDNADYNVWTTDPNPLIIEIDMTTNPIPVRSNATWQLGLTTRSSGVGVDNIKVEIWDGSAYATVYDAAPGIHALNITGFGFFVTPQFISYAANGYAIEKLKVTVDVDAATVANGFRIQRIMLYHPTQTWDPWKVSRNGDSIYGALDVQSRLRVADNSATAVAGDIRYNSGTSKHQGYDGATWNDMY